MEKQTQTPAQPTGQPPAQTGGPAHPRLAPPDPLTPAKQEG